MLQRMQWMIGQAPRLAVLPTVLACLLAGAAAHGDVKTPALFADHMVLQRNVPVPVWGSADPGEKVTVSIGAQSIATTAGQDGRWTVKLAPMQVGDPLTLTIQGRNTITITDVVVGEVWICSGQSNMGFPVQRAQNGTQEVANANEPLLRLFKGGWQVAPTPQFDVKGKWEPCTPQAAAGFSAVAYFFGRELVRDLKLPVGLIQMACDWTPAEAWMSREGLSADPEIKKAILDRWDQIAAEYPAKKAEYDQKRAEWEKAKAKAEADKQPVPAEPKAPSDPNFIHRATGLFNGGIAPLIPYAIRGVIWYQGETNDSRAHQYRRLFPLLIQDWRRAWGQGDFPFLYVQISSTGPLQPDPAAITDWHADWAEVREAQLMAISVTNTAMAVTIDIGDGEVHPANKQDVGLRLALAARALAYGQKVVYCGPLYDSIGIDGGKATIRFKEGHGGLVARGGEPKGFSIAGEDRKFVAARARIEGDTVVVWSDNVTAPAAVRYAWGNNPPCNLYNKDGLPASPFRTDDWPGNTFGKTRMFVDEQH